MRGALLKWKHFLPVWCCVTSQGGCLLGTLRRASVWKGEQVKAVGPTDVHLDWIWTQVSLTPPFPKALCFSPSLLLPAARLPSPPAAQACGWLLTLPGPHPLQWPSGPPVLFPPGGSPLGRGALLGRLLPGVWQPGPHMYINLLFISLWFLSTTFPDLTFLCVLHRKQYLNGALEWPAGDLGVYLTLGENIHYIIFILLKVDEKL